VPSCACCCAAVRVEWGRWGGGEPSPGFGVFVFVYLGGCIFSLSNRPSLPPPTSRSPLLCLFACVCVCNGSAPLAPWPSTYIPFKLLSHSPRHGGWGEGDGGRAHTHALSSRGPPPMHTYGPPSPHTQCTRITRTLYHSAPTHLCNNREGDRDGMGAMKSWPSYDTSWPSLPRAPVTPNNTPCQPSKQGSTATRRLHTKGSSLHDQSITPPRVVQCAGAVMAVTRGHMTGTPPRVVQCAGALMAVRRAHMTGTPPRVVQCAGARMAVTGAT
jgi:hypothetical protein